MCWKKFNPQKKDSRPAGLDVKANPERKKKKKKKKTKKKKKKKKKNTWESLSFIIFHFFFFFKIKQKGKDSWIIGMDMEKELFLRLDLFNLSSFWRIEMENTNIQWTFFLHVLKGLYNPSTIKII